MMTSVVSNPIVRFVPPRIPKQEAGADTMAYQNQDWDDIGRSIQDIIDRAVNSHDFQKLDQTIRQVVEKAVDAGTGAVRRAVTSSARTTRNTEAADTVAAEQNDLSALYGSTGSRTAGSVAKIVGGVLTAVFSALLVLADTAMNVFLHGNIHLTVPIALGAAGAAAGVLLMGSGTRWLGKLKRFRTYRRLLGQKTHVPLAKLAQHVGKNVKFVKKDVTGMMDAGLFLEGHLDHEQQHLITSHETYRHFEHSRLQQEELRRLEAQRQADAAKKAQEAPVHSPAVQEVLDRGDHYVAQIRRCNDAIPGEVISHKISRIELLVERIFDRVETHPEIIPDLKKMMDYYLPMTVKLLNAYAEMDAQPVQGETIQSSKREIEDTLDTLNLAFEKLLDDLFADTALDVSSDISVLNTLLAQEGLADDDLSRLRKQTNP